MRPLEKDAASAKKPERYKRSTLRLQAAVRAMRSGRRRACRDSEPAENEGFAGMVQYRITIVAVM